MKTKRRLLLIDDDLTALAALKLVLLTRGYSVTTATSGEEGLELFLGNGFDLVLVNDLPPLGNGRLFAGLDGEQVAQAIKRQAPQVPVILYSRKKPGGMFPTSAADRFFGKYGSNLDLLEAVRILAMKKRGAKKPAAGVKVTERKAYVSTGSEKDEPVEE